MNDGNGNFWIFANVKVREEAGKYHWVIFSSNTVRKYIGYTGEINDKKWRGYRKSNSKMFQRKIRFTP